MLRKIMEAQGGKLPDNVLVTFCNTGLEHPETLKFVERCSIEWEVPVIWLEYRRDQQHKFAVVDYATAARNGEPFTELIESRKYLPNPVTRFCTVELKIRTMDRYGISLDWPEYTECVGLRADEMHRVTRLVANNRRNEVICPMATAGHTLKDVELFWSEQSFRLDIPNFLGNCVGCFLKSRHKIEAIARQAPEFLSWWSDHEEKSRNWNEEWFAKRFTFRSDRPTYRQILKQVQEQPTLWNDDDYDTIPCACTD